MRLCLDVRPGSQSITRSTAFQQLAGCNRLTRCQVGFIFTQEDLVRRMRSIGLILIDKRGSLIDVIAVVIGSSHLPI